MSCRLRRRARTAGAQARSVRSGSRSGTDGRRIIQRFGKCIDAANGESFANRLRRRTEAALASESATEVS